MSRKIDLTGKKFGELIVLKEVGKTPDGVTLYECLCSCGQTKIIRANNLRSGNTKSCGHLFKENVKKMHITHGGTKERLHGVWKSMKMRCYNPNSYAFESYGGRGITVCDEWKNSYAAFREFALQNGYDENAERGKYTIERIDVNGNYEPSNCILISIEEQQRNKRSSNILNFRGESKPLVEFAIQYDIDENVLSYRLKSGWDLEEALLTPVREIARKSAPRYEVNGESYTLREWANILGLRKSILKGRLKRRSLQQIVEEIRGH